MSEPSAEMLLSDAMALLTTALELIDRADAPADIGAHIDHALQRIAQVLGTSDARDPDVLSI
jgi:hypothetical protein